MPFDFLYSRLFFKIYFILFCFSFCLYAAENPESHKEFMSEQAFLLADGNNEFALNLYKTIKDDVTGNLCISPYSISSALAMVYNGAREETQQEMRDVLKFTLDLDSLNEAFSTLNHFFTKTVPEVTSDFRMDIANSLWIQSGLTVLPEFLDRMGKYFKISLRRVDFLRQKEIARLEMNTFVKEKTFGKIKDLVQSSDITPLTKMILISALYMKAKWQKPFMASSTLMQPFFIDAEKTISAPFMAATAFYPYFKSEDFAAVEIPYIHPKEDFPELGFLILLPKQNLRVDDLEKKLNGALFKNIISQLENEQVALKFPKFTFSKAISLKNALIGLGMKTAFNSSADFSGIIAAKDLELGQVSHKVFIEVDENGTEAAAATAVSMNTKAIFNPKEPIAFEADRPFIFIIYEKLTHSILFCGRIKNPLE